MDSFSYVYTYEIESIFLNHPVEELKRYLRFKLDVSLTMHRR